MSCLCGKIPPLSVRLGRLTDVSGLSTFIGVYVLEHDLPPFALSLILVIQWRTKPVVVMKQIGSGVNYSSDCCF